MTEQAEFKAVPIHEAIARAKAECSPVGKDGWNPQQSFKYRGVDAVVNGAAQALNRYGVVIIPTVKLRKIEKRTYQSKGGATMLHVLVPVVYNLWGADGSGPVPVEVVGEASDAGDKGISKATSVAYRIMLIQVLNLPTGDADPDSESHERESASAGGDPWGNGNGRRSQGRGRQRGGSEDWRNLPPVNKPRRDSDAEPPAPEPQPARQAAGPQVPARPAVSADDELLGAWASKIDEIAKPEDAGPVLAELAASGLDSRQIRVIEGAVGAKVTLLGGRPVTAPSAEERGAKPVPTGKGDDGPWVTGFEQRLAATTDPESLAGLQGQIAAAARAKIITPGKATGLSAKLRERRTELQGAA